MFATSSTLLGLVLTSAGLVSAGPFSFLKTRAVIDHDKVVGFPETVPSGSLGDNYLRFKPLLRVVNGCVPFPAVDKDGNTSGGLQETGDPSGGCTSSTGQVYARAFIASNATNKGAPSAIMYSWYMPKDSPISGIGHRHDWENVVVFLSAPTDDTPSVPAGIRGLAASQHGGYTTTTSPAVGGGKNTSVLVRYESVFPLDHALFADDAGETGGGSQPLIAWESLTQAARDALNNTDFGDADFPLKDGAFETNLGKAALPA